nr:hypothetical protein [uncultured Pseudomonas sp.]
MELPTPEHFEAGSDDTHGHTHQSIEGVLRELGFHESGNHLNEILRTDLVARFPDAVDELEATWPNEKAFRYARYIAHLPSAHQGLVEIASLLLGDGEVLLIETPYATAAQLVSRNNIYPGQPTPVASEAFEASSSHSQQYSHESIEANLLSLLPAREVRSISFGNWLRDYSQLLDPKLVRATHQPINFPAVLSRETLTGIVDILAARKFSGVRADNRSAFTVTAQKRGAIGPASMSTIQESSILRRPIPPALTETSSHGFAQAIRSGLAKICRGVPGKVFEISLVAQWRPLNI